MAAASEAVDDAKGHLSELIGALEVVSETMITLSEVLGIPNMEQVVFSTTAEDVVNLIQSIHKAENYLYGLSRVV